MDDYIKLKNLHFRFPETTRKQLNGITLSIKEFDVTVIVGKVGSGKSTLLRHINGLYKPSKGEVIIDDKTIDPKAKINFKEIGFLFENPEDQIFYPIVADDIAFGPRNLKLRKKEVHKRVIEVCEEVGILHLLEREIISLSLGEKTLVALAGILAMKPKILILDSPGVGLDFWTKPRIIKMIKDLSTNHTIIIATNDMDFLKIADRIFLLHDGKVKGKYKSYRTFRNALKRRTDTLSQPEE
ncbi:MAG: ABC transporter ATP-binding protein [Candidatus Heimdallarchaeota archaeon]|nr:ABC transporter ATP-binding protein [Candidatus Heimdallarchaeota archaeon]